MIQKSRRFNLQSDIEKIDQYLTATSRIATAKWRWQFDMTANFLIDRI
jgi:hypothetical protein